MSSNAVRANGPTTSEKGSAHPPVDLPPLPAGEATLLGGTIVSVDSVRDRLIFQAFGGGRSSVLFDERTRVFRDGRRGSLDELRKGERAYVDTVLDGTDVFARNIRLAGTATGESTGQVLGVEPGSGELTLRDPLSPEPVTMRLNADTAIIRGNQKATVADLRPGTLVALSFAGGGDVPTVRQISILAAPGAAFVFSGRIEHIDLHRGLLVLRDPRDNKSYEVNLDPSAPDLTRNLQEGVSVTVETNFDGLQYVARTITVNPSSR